MFPRDGQAAVISGEVVCQTSRQYEFLKRGLDPVPFGRETGIRLWVRKFFLDLRDLGERSELVSQTQAMKTHPHCPEVNSSSMADIAFLLLTFFLVTTTIDQPKGVMLMLPAYDYSPPVTPMNERNLFVIQINSMDMLMVEGEGRTTAIGLRDEIKGFVLNGGSDVRSSDTPEAAIVSIRTDRGTSYKKFIEILDEAQAAYFSTYAEKAGMTPKQFRSLDTSDPRERHIYDEARKGIPMNISIAESTNAARHASTIQ
jgi:biopolymer transport protein ExbD